MVTGRTKCTGSVRLSTSSQWMLPDYDHIKKFQAKTTAGTLYCATIIRNQREAGQVDIKTDKVEQSRGSQEIAN